MKTKKIQTKVLIIDDNEDDLLIMEKYLRKGGYKSVLKAGSAEEGVSLAKRERPGIALVDIRLPGLDGIRTCAILKERAGVQAVIMVTGLDDQSAKDLSVSYGADGYMVKPISVEELKIKIEGITGKNSPKAKRKR